jgi:signal transduction histidine kinase
MIPPRPLPDEDERLAALFRYDLLDTPREGDFDDLVTMAMQLCGVEIALISLVDENRQWFKACVGIDVTETPREISFCGHAIHQNDIFEVPDATLDVRFADNPLVTGAPYIRFYAGKPLLSADGYKLGTLCLVHSQPKILTSGEREILCFLAKQVEKQFDLRLSLQQAVQNVDMIRRQAAKFEEGNQIRDQLISVIAHDLRSPVASLESLVSAFDARYLGTEDLLALLQQLRPELTKTSLQLNQVLIWAQRQMSASLRMEPFSVAAIAEQSLDWVRERAKVKQIKLSQQLEPELCTSGDPELVHIVLRNFLVNAVKYSRKHDRVTLFAYREEQQIVLGVHDTGLGMSPETLDKLRKYQRPASVTGTDAEQGFGLGLLLCHTYLQRMQTQLDIESALGQGSTFSLRCCSHAWGTRRETPDRR